MGTTRVVLADAAARRLVEERLDLNVLVEAGAGSGKTHSLARRMAAGIVSGKYRVEEIAAVTFTRKAAAELRGRFQLALEERLSAATGEERARIERALGNLEHLFAGTIHSFCAHLLRERPVEANIAPGFTELDELEDGDLRRRAWRDYLSRLRGEGSTLLLELQQARVSARDLDAAFATVCTFDEVEFPPGDARRPALDGAREALGLFSRRLQALMPKAAARDAKCGTLERARRFRGLMRAASGGGDADVVEALRCWEKPAKVTMKWWVGRVGADGEWEPGPQSEQKSVREKVEALVGEFQATTALPFLSSWRQYLYRLVVTLLADAREYAREERRRALALNYGDLLVAAATLLRGNPSVRAALQRKYRWLFVDEFQDTDPIQAEVMLLLAADESAGSQASPCDAYALPLRPGALFVVGDPKQSIYRFRRADIEIYNRVRETIRGSGGAVVALTTSFRARPALCEWTNEVFSRLLPAEPTQHQAAFRRLDADPKWKRRTEVGVAPGLCTLTLSGDIPKPRVVACDARSIARFIDGEVRAKRAAWQDFMVLTRKRAHLAEYASALNALDVPAEVSGAGAFGGSPFVGALIDLLQVLGDPADGVALVGVLRGPLFGISDADLFAHRQTGGYFGLTTSRANRTATGAPQSSPVAAALDRLGEFLRLTRVLPLAAAVERILEDTGLVALAAAGEGGAAPAGDVLHAVDIVRAVAEEGGTLADAATALQDAADASDVESVALEPGRRDVVRVMNLHKAKGLEAPVVFLADPLGGTKKHADVRIVREGASARGYLAVRKAVGEWASELIAHPEGWDAHEQAELAYVEAEETRLLYVAATRARELLVVSRWNKESRSARAWAALEDQLATAGEIAVPAAPQGSLGDHTAVDVSARARKQAARARASGRVLACRPSWAVTSVTADKTVGRNAENAAGMGAASTRTREDAGSGSTGPRADAGVAWGSLVHALLEYAMRHRSAARGDLERLARWLIVETPELRPFVPEALDLVDAVSKSAAWQDARARQDVQVEVPFAMLVPASATAASGEAVPAILRGVIDLVYRAADGWHIVDYKTDQDADERTLQSRHAAQLAAYRRAWERVTGEKVSEARALGVRTT